MSERLLVRGRYVLSMDPEVGELPAGEVLIQDGRSGCIFHLGATPLATDGP